MILSQSEHERFFRLIHGLQFDAISQLSLPCSSSTLEEFAALPLIDKASIRDAVYENPSVITDYADRNPNQLSPTDLDCVRQWVHFVKGNFIVERHLKNYSIWIHNNETYAVGGLSHPQEDILPKYALPIMVEGVILPYNGKIVFDGILYHRSISFGSGIKRSLKETYMTAKQNGRVVETLGGQPTETCQTTALAPAKSWRKELVALENATNRFKGENHPLHKDAINVMKASQKLAATALGESHENINALADAHNAVVRAVNRYKKALSRANL